MFSTVDTYHTSFPGRISSKAGTCTPGNTEKVYCTNRTVKKFILSFSKLLLHELKLMEPESFMSVILSFENTKLTLCTTCVS